MSIITFQIVGHKCFFCLFFVFFRQTSEKHQMSILLVLCEANTPVKDGFPSQSVSNTDNISTAWHHDVMWYIYPFFRYALQLMTLASHACYGGRIKNEHELLNLRALKISMFYKNHIFQCMGKIFSVEFQRVPLKFHTNYLVHTLKDVDFIHGWK